MRVFVCLLICWLSGTTIVSGQITISAYFESGSATSGYNLEKVIDSIVLTFQSQKIKEIQLKGYCDSDGDSLFNIRLSANRTKYIINSLVNSGIPKSIFLSDNAYGENFSIPENGNAALKQQNRRVEVILYGDSSSLLLNSTIVSPIDSMAYSIVNAEVGDIIIIPNLEFYPGRHTLMPESQPVLQQLVEVMKNNPSLTIKLIGHICCMTEMQKQMSAYRDGFDADDGTNHLSLNRAIIVKSYLTDYGIAADRISVKGEGGAKKLIDPEITEEDKKRNRRVEILILSK